MQKQERKRYSFNALLLVFSTLLVKVVSVLYKIPLTNLIGVTGRGYFGIAYNLYVPIIAICIGGFPVAVSKMVSEALAKNNFEKIKAIKKVSTRIFIFLGIAGTLFLVLFAKEYTNSIAKQPLAYLSVIVVAPSIFFCCLAGANRGYFEGFSNMVPTAVAQVIEVLFKSVFGLLFAKFAMSSLYNEYLITSKVFGTIANSQSEAMSLIYPYTAAASMAGATIGAFVAWMFLKIYSLSKSYRLPFGMVYKGPSVTKELISVATPILIASVVQSLSNLIDASSLQSCLSNCNINDLEQIYSQSIKLSSTVKNDVVTYIYGIYNTVLDFKNLVPMLTGAVGVAFLPALSGAFAMKDSERLEELTNLFIRYSVVIGSGIGFGIAAMPKEIICLLYSKGNMDIAIASEKIMIGFGFTMIIYALSGPIIYAVQAIGCAKKSILSFVVGGAIRVAFNYMLVSDSKYNLLGSVISSGICMLIIVVWNMIIFINNTGVKIDWYHSLIKPFLVGISVYFVTDYLKIRFNIIELPRIFVIIFIGIIGLYYLICLISLNILDLSKLKSYKSVKNN